MHVFDGKNWISIFWLPYFPVLPTSFVQTETSHARQEAMSEWTNRHTLWFVLWERRVRWWLFVPSCCLSSLPSRRLPKTQWKFWKLQPKEVALLLCWIVRRKTSFTKKLAIALQKPVFTSGPFTQDVKAHLDANLQANPLMLLVSCVNTPIDHNRFHNLHVRVARCSASCVNWAF